MTQITTKVHFIWIKLIAVSSLHTKSNVCLNKAYPLSPSSAGSPGLGIHAPSLGCFFLLLSTSSALSSSVQFSSVTQSCPTLCDPMDCSTPGLLVHHWSPLKLISIELVMPSNHLILCHPLLLPPSAFPHIRVFSYESVLCIRWPKYWSFSISPSNEYSGLISFRMDWLDLLEVQGTLRSLLQHHSSKASILLCSAFFIHTGPLEKP